MRRSLLRLWRAAFVGAVLTGVCALGAPAAGAASPASAFVPKALLTDAQQNPDKLFQVIVQGASGGGAAPVAAAVRAEVNADRGNGVGLKRQFATIAGVAAELTGKQLVVLARMPAITAITTDAPVKLTGLSNNQQWPFVSGVARGWSNVTNGSLAKPPAIAIVDSGIDASRADFGGRVVKQVTL